MPTTAVHAFGRLEMDYVAFGHPHVVRFWVGPFGVDSGVGTFDAPGSPASLDALATELSVPFAALFATAASMSFGAWRGIKTTNVDGAGVVVVEGTITPGTLSFQSSAGNAGAVAQCTYSWRDVESKLAKVTALGAVYQGPDPYVYSSLSSTYKALSDYITASSRIVSRGDHAISSLIHVTFDTNDGLTRRYRR